VAKTGLFINLLLFIQKLAGLPPKNHQKPKIGHHSIYYYITGNTDTPNPHKIPKTTKNQA